MEHNSCSIVVENVDRYFGKQQILYNINLKISYSQIFGLLGPSGSGKTTLVKMISGIDMPTHGQIYVLGEKMPKLSMMNKMGYMAQSDALYGDITAEENLKFFAAMYNISKRDCTKRIDEVMELVNLSEDLKKRVSQYSGGMKRRLSLAIAMLNQPPVLILDEPTVGIDPVLRKSIWDELNGLSKKGTTIIITTHVMDEADKCDNLCMIRNGRVIAVGTPEILKKDTDSNTIEEAFLYYGGKR
ncbi:ABC transporter ATP-binding protein [Clostridium sp. Mt-5]|uniref:ABC transporter ATP-binding protein n=1 Tax=Clostridium moutaii TaxID=3240932 RepID=A0ABV4BRB6_9CLOT